MGKEKIKILTGSSVAVRSREDQRSGSLPYPKTKRILPNKSVAISKKQEQERSDKEPLTKYILGNQR